MASLARVEKRKEDLLARLYTAERRKHLERLEGEIREKDDLIKGLPKGNMVYAASTHFKGQGQFKPTNGKPRVIRFLHRGEVTQPRDEVSPGTLPILRQSHGNSTCRQIMMNPTAGPLSRSGW